MLGLFLRDIVILLCVFFVYQLIIRVFRKLFHFPAPAFIGKFLDSDYRRKVQPPDLLIQRSGIKNGMNVLEIGCGSGAMTTYVAKAVGTKGTVYALDIQKDMLKQLEKKLARPENQNITNVKMILGDATKLPFGNNSLDLVYLVTVLQEIPNRSAALVEIRRVLKPGGILAVTELLPDPDYVIATTTAKQGKQAGFRVDKISGNLFNYTVRFTKPPQNSTNERT